MSNIEKPTTPKSLLRQTNDLELVSVVERASLYERIINDCIEGYLEEAVTPRGEIVAVTKRDLGTALKALEKYNELIIQEDEYGLDNEQSEPKLVINIGEVGTGTPKTIDLGLNDTEIE